MLAKKVEKLNEDEMVKRLSSIMKINKTSFFASLSDAGEFDIETHKSIDWSEHRVFVSVQQKR